MLAKVHSLFFTQTVRFGSQFGFVLGFVYFFGCAMHSFFVCAEFWAALSFGEVFSDNFLIQMCFVSARLPKKKTDKDRDADS